MGVGIGIHPCDVHLAPDNAVEQLRKFTTDERVCAIGETGLDYFHDAPEGWSEGAFRQRQGDFFEQQFQLAASAGLNIVVHTRDQEGWASFEEAMAIYQSYSDKVRAVFHCFLGDYEMAERIFGMGGLISFGGVATFKKSRALRDLIQGLEPGSFMLETDAPYLAPEPLRGRRNEPAWTKHVAKRIAELRGESMEELGAHTELAADEFFRWRS